jgi:hypothetical protein
MMTDPSADMRVGQRMKLEPHAHCGLCQTSIAQMIGCIDWKPEEEE